MQKRILLSIMTLFSAMHLYAQQSCATAIPAVLGTTTASTSFGTTPPAPAHCMVLNGSESFLWYTFTPAVDTNVRVSTVTSTNTGLDTRISVFSGTCGALSCIAYGDDESAFLSIATFAATAGTTYYIVFDTYWGNMPIDFTISYVSTGGGGGPIPQLITFTTQGIPNGDNSRCVMDMNGDHIDDIVYTSGNTLRVHYQTAPATFTSTTHTISGTVTNAPSWSIAGGDMDNNGYNDLIYGGGSGASIIMANSTGTAYTHYSGGQYIFSQRTNVVDINNDGIADAFVCHDIDANVFYISNGSGGFTWNQGGLGANGGNYGSVWIDYDNDCDMDLYIAKCGSDPIDQLHRNNGDGTYTSVGVAAGLNDATENWSSTWADFDNDGDMDVFMGASSNWGGLSHKLYRNNGNGTFTNITAGSGFDLYYSNLGIENYPGDFNNDGWVDVYGLGGLIMFNDGDMTFTASTSPVAGAAVGDLNQDGALDLVAGTTIYKNNLTSNNYIVVSTVGVQSNKNGIGARVTVQTASGSQIRDVRSGQAFSSMQTLNAHFGIGQETAIEKITICWPSGVVDVINNPAINSHLVVVEGSTVSVQEELSQNLQVFPNPATSHLSISGLPANRVFALEIFDVTGKLISTQQVSENVTVDVQSLVPGIYVARISGEASQLNVKFIKE
ncbi:MAG TPA: FG-GAP-like repeat-containing protein [Flavobacteriales bacterium]|nr:RNA-binding protein [Flavobacteriales bacterium]HRE74995.1 FG-GAP-like repeat-containing protein [Flavobacteriales bacterium]HRE95379.1 FG-GAP-like repeat-containing protein [Flavobacteriales bacterium]HRJ34546.1 FG-GAP-like repeat-containing protein [Flavobacteriales bacterium]HRJ38107.1 FG-GAP-like repeat-containing protein [Flavobacteriales bacterium]